MVLSKKEKEKKKEKCFQWENAELSYFSPANGRHGRFLVDAGGRSCQVLAGCCQSALSRNAELQAGTGAEGSLEMWRCSGVTAPRELYYYCLW